MKNAVYCLLVTVVIFSVACSSGKNRAESSRLPGWVYNHPVSSDSLFGIGISEQESMNLAKTTAEQRGRASIASQLVSVVQSYFRDYSAQDGIGDQALLSEVVSNVVRSISQETLRGARPVKNHYDQEKKVWYCLVELSINDAVSIIAQQVDKEMQREEALYHEWRAKRATEEMDEQLRRHFPR